jgi:hypothetical protein
LKSNTEFISLKFPLANAYDFVSWFTSISFNLELRPGTSRNFHFIYDFIPTRRPIIYTFTN